MQPLMQLLKAVLPFWYAVRRASAHIIVLSSYSPFGLDEKMTQEVFGMISPSEHGKLHVWMAFQQVFINKNLEDHQGLVIDILKELIEEGILLKVAHWIV
ncbi:hypothetical protein HPP92_003484 [Vanilla planifolia]|uniref:Uncharacterized protein n=1 Tax=Vanilla planifolia TaxID=51239 RepID=A0A835SFP5_VANPL|nr:hypothetical protein HPP92_003484 [Vanilla planifolia]